MGPVTAEPGDRPRGGEDIAMELINELGMRGGWYHPGKGDRTAQ